MNESATTFGKWLIVSGIILIIVGMGLLYFHKIPFLGKLPGDLLFRKGNFTFYFPLATCIVLSLVITLVFYLISKFR